MTRIFTKEHRKKISDSRKMLKEKGWVPYNKGLKTKDRKNGRELLLKNMAWHIRFDVSVEWLSQFEDIEKLKFLNRCISKRKDRFKVDTKWYMEYILRFYNDEQFNKIYSKWIGTGNSYLRPTIDHINPKSNGGNNAINNLQFLTWFENRAKNDMPMVVWQKLKENIKYYLI